MNELSVPADFPRSELTGAVPGVQAKQLARLIDGQYIIGWTEEERAARHEYCEDLVQQLVSYCQRKSRENAHWTHEFNFERMSRGLAQKSRTGEWDVTVDEQAWMTARIRLQLGWFANSTLIEGDANSERENPSRQRR